jgi:hypothetical protein
VKELEIGKPTTSIAEQTPNPRLQSWAEQTRKKKTHDFSRGKNKQGTNRNRFNGFRTVS